MRFSLAGMRSPKPESQRSLIRVPETLNLFTRATSTSSVLPSGLIAIVPTTSIDYISRLPPELLLLIFDFVYDSCPSLGLIRLCRLARASKIFLCVACHFILPEDLIIPSPVVSSLLKTLGNRSITRCKVCDKYYFAGDTHSQQDHWIVRCFKRNSEAQSPRAKVTRLELECPRGYCRDKFSLIDLLKYEKWESAICRERAEAAVATADPDMRAVLYASDVGW